jgi:hypothetical protein
LLELGDPIILGRHTLLQPRDLLIHPKQHRHDHLAALLIDRLSVRAIHAP